MGLPDWGSRHLGGSLGKRGRKTYDVGLWPKSYVKSPTSFAISVAAPLRPPTGCGIIFPFSARGIMPFRGSGAPAASSTVPTTLRRHLIFDIPAAFTAGPVATLVGRSLRECRQRSATQNCRAHGCAPTAERTQQCIVALGERPLISSLGEIRWCVAWQHAAYFPIHV